MRLTAILWIVSLAAHLRFDCVAGGNSRDGSGSHNPALPRGHLHRERLLVQARAQWAAIPAQASPIGLA